MAKPIQVTPDLSGKEADDFIRKMIETENREPTEFEKNMRETIEKNKDKFQVGYAQDLHDKKFVKDKQGEKEE